jgi:hypothetical protein
MHNFSAHDIGELKQLRAQVAEWQTAAAGLNREVAWRQLAIVGLQESSRM